MTLPPLSSQLGGIAFHCDMCYNSVMQHHYTLSGQLVEPNTPGAYPSVTTILAVHNKPSLNAWKARVGEQAAREKQQEASKRGKAVHAVIENKIKGQDYERVHETLVDGYEVWASKNNPADVESEIFLYSDQFKYAGTADIICRLQGELWLIDLKTSKQIDKDYGLQLRAYEQALYELRGEHARTAVLQLNDTTKRHYRFKEMNEPLEVFLAMKVIFDWDNADKPEQSRFDGRYLTKV